MAGEQAQVSRDTVASGQPDDIAGHQMHGVQPLAGAIAHHDGVRGNGAGKCRQRGFGLAFLDIADEGIDDHDTKDDRAVDIFAERGGNAASHDQYQHQGRGELRGQTCQGAPPGCLARLIGAVARQACRRFRRIKATGRIDIKRASGCIRGEMVPVWCVCHPGFCNWVFGAVVIKQGRDSARSIAPAEHT
jgi:hypothetical protein